MRKAPVARSLFAALLAVAPAVAAEERASAELSAAIVAGKGKSGAPVIDRASTFQVVFTNHSRKPIRLWSKDCQLGYATLTFRVVDGDGAASLLRKSIEEPPTYWEYKRAETITILPGKTFAWEVALADKYGPREEWTGEPEPNTGRPVTLTAVLSVPPSDAARQHGVWTGRVVSQPIKVLVVDARLRTPFDYLWYGFPKQALKLMQADRTWINKRDDNRHTPLHLAVRYGHVEVARWLLDHGADVNAKAINDITPLHYAKHSEMVKLLLKKKANVNAKSLVTALEQAAHDYAYVEGNPDDAAQAKELLRIITILRGAGAEYGVRSACCLGDEEQVRALVAADKKQALDKTAMRRAATYGRTKIVKFLLQHGADPEDADCGGLTLSYFAIEHTDVLKLLFDAGADPKVRIDFRGNGRPPDAQGLWLLHVAAGGGFLESAKLLLARGNDVNRAGPSGLTPLHTACRGGQAQMVEWLLRNGANPRARTREGWAPMALAAYQVWSNEEEPDKSGYQNAIRALARAGVEMDVFAAIACDDVGRVAKILEKNPKAGETRDLAGWPALHRAVMLDRREIVRRLLEKGMGPNVRSRGQSKELNDDTAANKETALHQAAFWGRPEIAALLIKRGADVNARDARGDAPLHEAACLGRVEIARLLLKHGADVNAKGGEGMPPLDQANSHPWKLPEMVKLLRDHGAKK